MLYGEKRNEVITVAWVECTVLPYTFMFVYYVYYMISTFIPTGFRTMSTTCLNGPEIATKWRK